MEFTVTGTKVGNDTLTFVAYNPHNEQEKWINLYIEVTPCQWQNTDEIVINLGEDVPVNQ